MTADEWERCTDPGKMLDFLRGKASDRKVRLFAVACCRRAWHLLTEPCRKALATAERFADGQVSDARRKAARGEAFQAKPPLDVLFPMPGLRLESAGTLAKQAVCDTLAKKPASLDELEIALAWDAWAAARVPSDGGDLPACLPGDWPAEQVARFRRGTVNLVLDVFGNPFRLVLLNPLWQSWHGGTVRRLAEAVYEERNLPSGHLDAARLAILADMLEEAGCCDAGLLGHLRSAGPHVRGCWAVDVLIGKG
jgi:hypothetical protein